MIIRNYALMVLLLCVAHFTQAQEIKLMVQHGHIFPVENVVISQDGKLLASKDERSIKVWEMGSGRLIQDIDEGRALLKSKNEPFVFGKDTKSVLTFSVSHLGIYDIGSGEEKERKSTMGYDNGALSANGRVMAVGNQDKPIKVQYLDGRRPYTFKDSLSRFQEIALSDDGKKVAATFVSKEGKASIGVWDTQTGEELDRYENTASKMVFSPDGNLLMVIKSASKIEIRDIVEKKLILEQSVSINRDKRKHFPLSAKFLPDGKGIALLNHELIFVSLSTQKTTRPIEFETIPSAIAFDPQGKRFALSLGDKGIQVYNLSTKKLIWEVNNPTAPITAQAFSKDYKYMAIANENEALVKVWDLETGSLFRTMKSNNQAVRALSFSAEEYLLAVGGSDGEVDIMDIRQGKIALTFKDHDKLVSAVRFHPTEPILASGGEDQAIFIWEAKTGNIVHRLLGHEKHKGEISKLIFSPDGEYLVSGSSEVGMINGRSLKCWSMETGKALHDFGGIKKDVHAIVFSPEKDRVIVSRSSAIVEFDIKSGKKLPGATSRTLYATREMAVSPDGKYLAVYTGREEDKASQVDLIDFATNKREKSFRGHEKSIKTINFLKEGELLLTSSNDHSLRFWDVETRKEIMSLYMFDRGRAWVVIDSTGRFDSNDGGRQYLHYVNGTDVIRLSQLIERYYEPGLMAKHLGQRPEPLRETEPLKEEDLGPIVDLELNGSKLLVKLTPRSGGLGRVGLYVNHKEIEADLNPSRSTQFQLDLTNYNKYFIPNESTNVGIVAFDREDWLESDLVQVDYTLIASVKGEDTSTENPIPNTDHSSETGTSNSDNSTGTVILHAANPRLFALCIGTSNYNDESFDLSFADKDAHKFAAMLQDAGKALFDAQSVEVKVLTTSNNIAEWPSKNNIRQAMKDFANRTKASDVFVLYLSGHGNTSDKDGKDYFYYLTHDMSSGNLDDAQIRSKYAISTDEFTTWLNNIPAQKQVMMLDACASGKFNESAQDLLTSRNVPASQVRALDRLRSRTGLFIISGSTADQVSYEASPFGQGLLTYSLLLGVQSGEALKDEQYIDVLNLFNYAKERVPDLANQIGGIQEPMILMPYGSESYDIGRATVDVRGRIELEDEKPFFCKAGFMDLKTYYDDLGLGAIINEQMRDFALRNDNPPFIFINVDDDPNSYKIRGGYEVSGEDITITVNVLDTKGVALETFEVSGKKSDLERLGRSVIRRAYRVVE